MKKTTIFSLIGLLLVALFLPSCKKLLNKNNNRIVLLHWMTDRDKTLQELARLYKEQTQVDVVIRLFAPTDAYAQNISVGAQTNTLPDIFGVLGDNATIASYVKAGHVLKLDDYYHADNNAWQSRFYNEALETGSYKPENEFGVPPGIYGVPIDITTIALIYNKKLFRKAGLDPDKPPETWDQFIEVGKKLKNAGVSGFVSGWAEGWLIYAMATNIASNVMGMDKMMDTFRGKISYMDPQWLEVFGVFERIYKAGFADISLVSLINKYAEQAFATERSGMSFNGSWVVNIYEGMNPNLEYGVFKTPALSKKFPPTVWGAAGSVFYVNGHSEKKDMAVAFLKWLTEPAQAAYLLKETKNIPAIRGLEDGFSPIIKQFSEMMENSIHPSRFAVSEEPKVIEIFTKGIQAILIGEKSPARVAQEIQQAKEKALRKHQ